MALIIKFGDVVRYNENEYVFLAQNDGIIYAAKILDKNTTGSIQKLEESRYKKNSIQKVKNNVLYSYVILSTDEFKDRMAHLNNTDKNNFELVFDITCTLNNNDQKKIKEEILNESSAVSAKLKQIIKDIDIA